MRCGVCACLVVCLSLTQLVSAVRQRPAQQVYDPDNEVNEMAMRKKANQGPKLMDKNTGEIVELSDALPPAGVKEQHPAKADLADVNPVAKEVPQHRSDPRARQEERVIVTDLGKEAACEDDFNVMVERGTCNKKALLNTITLLMCIHDNGAPGDFGAACQAVIWDHKKKLSIDASLIETTKITCNGTTALSHCQGPRGPDLVSCLVEHLQDESLSTSCGDFLIKISSIIFSDYRLIKQLVVECEKDIETLQCKLVIHAADTDRYQHSQGKVIDCLKGNYTKVQNPKCKHEILRLSELQSDDFHLDTALFYACREDRERFCKNVRAGEGKVYKCLFDNKINEEMSRQCQHELRVRQRVANEDYKVEKTFATECAADIAKYECVKKELGNEDIHLFHIIHCLATKTITGECLVQVKSVRKQLMSDYLISPGIVSSCSTEIEQHCSGLMKGGETLNCLMGLARQSVVGKDGRKSYKKIIGLQCNNKLQDLVDEANVESDPGLDPYLMSKCGVVAAKFCKGASQDQLMSCLMQEVDTDHMTGHEECEEALLSLHYFLAREWSLDHMLYKECKTEAVNLCGATNMWADTKGQQKPGNGPTVLFCLVGKLLDDPDTVNPKCAKQISRVMQQRSKSVDLLPSVEGNCITDLARFCSQSISPGSEMTCLEDNYDTLTEECRKSIARLVQAEEQISVNINHVITKACDVDVKTLCRHEAQSARPTDLIDCLITNKDRMDNIACRSAIEHHQILQLKNIKFDARFREACSKDAVEFCKLAPGKESQTADEIIWCLSEVIRNDTVFEKPHRISDTCRKRVQHKLFNKQESLDLDPTLHKACMKDMFKYCKGENKPQECLEDKYEDLGPSCQSLLLKHIHLAAFQTYSRGFKKNCASDIKVYCPHHGEGAFECLVEHKKELKRECVTFVKKRQRLRGLDVRLNPNILTQCHQDIVRHCSSQMPNPLLTIVDEVKQGPVVPGAVLNCLRLEYVKSQAGKGSALREKCQQEMGKFIKHSSAYYAQDSFLTHKCKKEINTLCAEELEDEDSSRVEACLMAQYDKYVKGELDTTQMTSECRIQIARVAKEYQADIHNDPQLFAACAVDTNKLCQEVPPGEGRLLACLAGYYSAGQLTSDCKSLYEQRMAMWQTLQHAPETIREFGTLLNESGAKNDILVLISVVMIITLLLGLLCGRVSKRVAVDLKNK